jgi:hypothetical protein
MTVIRFRPRGPDRSMEIVSAIFEALRRGVDTPSAVIAKVPGLARAELFKAFSRAHHILNNLQRELLKDLGGGDGGQSA